MLRTVAVVMLMCAFALQSFQKAFIVLDYYVNTSAFAKKCVNKKLPVLKCHGKCLLMKKLMAEQKKEEKNPGLKLENKNETYLLPSTENGISGVLEAQLTYPNKHIQPRLSSHSNAVFHPPAAA